MNIQRIIIAADAFRTDAETIGDGPGSLSIELTRDMTGAAASDTHWAASGAFPQEQVALYTAEPSKFKVYETDGSLTTFLAVLAVLNMCRREYPVEM